jgi:hypothetical protein
MSRPIAADGTIRYSTLSALAWAAFHKHSPNTATNAVRSNVIAMFSLDAVATLTTALLGRCPALTVLATGREPMGWPTR